MNTVIENIMTRRSCRHFKPDMLPDDIIEAIIHAAIWAPTGKGKQSPLVVAVKDRETRDLLSDMNARIMSATADPFYGAPVVVVVLADKTVPTHVYDGSAVLTTMMLAAHSLGIGSCWINRAKEEFDSGIGKELLRKWGITGDYEGIGHCVLGYASAPVMKPAARKGGYTRLV